jgi:hypothetical protein
MAYDIDRNYMYRQAARYIDMIFKGAKPGEIPIYHMIMRHSVAVDGPILSAAACRRAGVQNA